MSFPTLPLEITTAVPGSTGSSAKTQVNLLKAKLGNNYVFSAPNGLNAVSTTWTVRWDNVTIAQWKMLEDFFASRKGQPFYWQPDDAPAPILWTCESWEKTAVTGMRRSGTATFEQSFRLG